jgi:hypothetical protein
MTNPTDDTRQAARLRVWDDGELSEYEDLLLGYEWDNQDEHLLWVATAERGEILSWCQVTRRNQATVIVCPCPAWQQLELWGE